MAFLAASNSLLRAKSNELLVIGIGTRTGKRSVVREVFVREGSKGSVGLPVSVQAQVRGHIEEEQDAELLHVHDRRVLLAHVEATVNANVNGGRRRVRFHLVENYQMHEYVLPPWEALRPLVEPLLRSVEG
jgi:hypothetical protein